jgi:predicted MFS family arabinose efflux permease
VTTASSLLQRKQANLRFQSSLDRSNLGNAKTDGLSVDLHLKKNEYSLTLTLYYITFILLGPLMVLFTKTCSAKVSLPCMMIAFGIASATTAAVKNFDQLIASRLIVGAFESGFLAS